MFPGDQEGSRKFSIHYRFFICINIVVGFVSLDRMGSRSKVYTHSGGSLTFSFIGFLYAKL